jgi:hypothetical protein
MEVNGQFHTHSVLLLGAGRGKITGTLRIGGCVGFRAALDAVENRKIVLLPEIEPRPSSA